MKKLFQVSVTIVLALALAFTVFSVKGAGSGVAAGLICPNVGWNTRAVSCSLGASPLQSLRDEALQLAAGYILPKPNVGWNT